MRLPGKLVLIAFCVALYTLITAIPPVRADHPSFTPYVCTTLDAALQAAAYVDAGELEELRTRTRNDPEFKCMDFPNNIPLYVREIVHTYMQGDVQKVVVRGVSENGQGVYVFGPKAFALGLLHANET